MDGGGKDGLGVLRISPLHSHESRYHRMATAFIDPLTVTVFYEKADRHTHTKALKLAQRFGLEGEIMALRLGWSGQDFFYRRI